MAQFQAPLIGMGVTLTTPSADGPAGRAMVTDGNGILSLTGAFAAAAHTHPVSDLTDHNKSVHDALGIDAASVGGTTPTAFGKSLIDDANALAARTTLGLDSDDTVQFGDLTVNSLVVAGGSTQLDSTVTVHDPLIKLADNNSADVLDLGHYAKYVSSGTKYSGLFRDASDGKYKLFAGLQTEPTATVDTAGTGYTVASLVANLEGNVTGAVNGVTLTTGGAAANYLNGAGSYSAVAYSGLTGIPATFAPSAHASSHMSAGTDAIRLDELKAPTDTATLDVSITLHGLAPKAPNDATKFLNGVGAWAVPAYTGPGGSNKQIQFNNSSAFGGATGFEYQSGASPNVLITSQSASHVPLSVKGTTSQSGNLLELNSVTPTLLFGVDTTGKVIGNTASGGLSFSGLTFTRTDGLQFRYGLAGCSDVNNYFWIHVITSLTNAPVTMGNSVSLTWASLNTSSLSGLPAAVDTILRRGGVATLQMGNDATSPIAQIFKAANAITNSNVAGANLSLQGGGGTGNAVSGSILLQTADQVASGSGAQSYTTKLTVGQSLITIADAINVALNATTGTKWGTATTQKQSWWNAAPVAQAAGIADADGTLADVTSKFNSLIAKFETYGLLAVA